MWAVISTVVFGRKDYDAERDVIHSRRAEKIVAKYYQNMWCVISQLCDQLCTVWRKNTGGDKIALARTELHQCVWSKQNDLKRTLSIMSTPVRKFLSTAYSSRLMDLDCAAVLLSLFDTRCTLPTAAPSARALRSLLTLRRSTARNAAAVTYLTALASDPDLPTCRVALSALLWCTPIVVVDCPHR